MVEVATDPEAGIVVASAVGAVGLVPTYRALEAGKDVALANKETLVMAGALMMAEARARGCRVLPIDSEHCALHQCLDGRRPEEVRRLVLTASGGPFRNRPQETFDKVTREEALNHPTWSMGRKITIDSATLMNKGLEVIEAHWLFGVDDARIEVLIHPQSIVHSMVEFVDGTVLAQLGVTDMRMPIQYALSHPERWPAAIPGMDFTPGNAPRLRDARPRALPLPGPGLPRARGRGLAPRGPERRQRGGGRGLSRRPDPLQLHSRNHRPGDGRSSADDGPGPRRTCSRPTAGPGPGPRKRCAPGVSPASS